MINLCGEKVYHKTFGQGAVIDQDGDVLTISFNQGNKKFLYPDAFVEHLTVIDTNTDLAIKKIIAEIKAARIAYEQEKLKDKKIVTTTRKVSRVKTDHEKYSPCGKQYFFVFQNKSFEFEQRGRYLWAPKTNQNGHNVSHLRLMDEVKKGDVIFHSYNKNIAAISIATSNCYSAKQPDELKRERLWEDDGWRVDVEYIMIKSPIITSDYLDTIIELQPSKYAPFNIRGGNMGYLYSSNYDLSKFLYEKSLAKNTYLSEIAEEIGLKI